MVYTGRQWTSKTIVVLFSLTFSMLFYVIIYSFIFIPPHPFCDYAIEQDYWRKQIGIEEFVFFYSETCQIGTIIKIEFNTST